MIQLYDYQARDQEKALRAFKSSKRVVLQASTGYGKTVVLADTAKRFVNATDKDVLVLVNRQELLQQTRDALVKINVSSEPINDKTTFLLRNTRVYVAMVESLYNRMQKDSNFLDNIGLIITDECHIQVFTKLIEFFPNALELGCTATPILNERVKYFFCPWCRREYDSLQECCGTEAIEYSKPRTLSEHYNDIVVGYPIEKLIERGSLVAEYPIVSETAGLENLKERNGEFTKKSLDDNFGNDSGLLNVLTNYKEYCEGKKTIVFSSSTKVNKKLYLDFIEARVNARMYDSVNIEESGKRSDLLEWFENTPDAVLLNVGTFTTGFDEPTIEACILNTDTMSLSLYLQMVGRAGRSTDKIYKPYFILIDCGRNIQRFGLWSDETRDWRRLFFEGIGEKRPVRKQPIGFETCEECWYTYERHFNKCPECGYAPPEPPPPTDKDNSIDALALPIREVPPPSASGILRFVKAKNENINFGHKVLISQIVDMFVFYRVNAELYQRTKANGKLKTKLGELIRPTYFTLLKSGLEGSHRTIRNVENRIIKRLDKMYGVNQ